MSDQEQRLRREIEERVRQLYEVKHARGTFEPGKAYVPYSGRVFDSEEMVSLVNSALDFWITSGPYAAQFERKLTEYTGAAGAVLVNSGSSANLLALSALTSPKLDAPLLPGDEVITTALSFPTTVNPIFQTGCVPVFVDVELGTYNADLSAIEAAIGPRTRAIMIAHALGNPFALAEIVELAERHDLYLIEDNCDALGATYDGKLTGTFGTFGTLSFYPAHQMTMGEGGAILYRHKRHRVLLESFRDWGRDCWCEAGKDNTCGKRFGWQLGTLPHGYDHKYTYSHVGYNLKATDLQAAIGVKQIDKVPSFVEQRRANFAALYETLEPYQELLILPRWEKRANPSWFGFPITVRPEAPFTKNHMVTFLEENKVATRSFFCGNLVRQPAYQGRTYRVSGSLANTDTVMESTFFVGVYPGITEPMLRYMKDSLSRFLTMTRTATV